MAARVLITGGGGFIGAWIARRLLGCGMQVRIFDLAVDPGPARAVVGDLVDEMQWCAGDVADAGAVRDAATGCDLLVHLAAILTPACQADPLLGARVNLMGTLNVFEAARNEGIARVLYMSSAGVFGPEDGVQPRPTTLYGAYKLAGEGCARAYLADHGVASAGFRPLVVYGPGRETGLTAGPTLACRAAARGEDYTIPFSGESDFVFVDDVAAAFEAAATSPLVGAEAYNVVGEVADVERVAALVAEAAPGAAIDVGGPPLPVAPRLAAGALRSVYPEVPCTTLEDGIRQTVEHYASAR